jgi:hypothetical protein
MRDVTPFPARGLFQLGGLRSGIGQSRKLEHNAPGSSLPHLRGGRPERGRSAELPCDAGQSVAATQHILNHHVLFRRMETCAARAEEH